MITQYAYSITHSLHTIMKGYKEKNIFGAIHAKAMSLLFGFFALFFAQQAMAQECGGAAPSVMAKWTFNTQISQCNGAVETPYSFLGKIDRTNPGFRANKFNYCPDYNSGCAKTTLGSKGFINTPNFQNALCLYNYYNPEDMARYATYHVTATNANGFDYRSSTWLPEIAANLAITYIIPLGKPGNLSQFALTILQKKFDGTTVNFEKQGVGVYRNGILIYSTTQNITAANINATPLTFTFPTTSDFTSDGSSEVKFEIVFGLVHRLVPPGEVGSPAQTAYDDISVIGTCGGSSPSPNANITKATCGTGGPNADGTITLTNFGATDKYDYTEGASYSGSATYASGSTTIPTGGVIVNTLPDPGTPKQYTVRVFSAICYKDLTVDLNPAICIPNCTPPTATLTATEATCAGATANNDAQLVITGVTDGDKVNYSLGATYTGAVYDDATSKLLVGGAYTFTAINNPVNSQLYTVRIFNLKNKCYIDKQVTLNEKACSPCANGTAQVIESSAADGDSKPNNGIATEDDQKTFALCKDTKKINLNLTKTVSPASGTTCPTGTDFVWTVTINNTGDMAATDIQIADILPSELSLVTVTNSTGTYGSGSGWLIPTLAAGASATLTNYNQSNESGYIQKCRGNHNRFATQ
jgi:uncharacterized repeat protein (TIGR01451 family)